MSPSNSFHIDCLRAELRRRKEKNPRYSLRAFAYTLRLDPSSLSRILAGKQPISLLAARRVTLTLKLSEEDRRQFLDSVAQERFRKTASDLAIDDEAPAQEADASLLRARVPIKIHPDQLENVRAKIIEFARDLSVYLPEGDRGVECELELRVEPAETRSPEGLAS